MTARRSENSSTRSPIVTRFKHGLHILHIIPEVKTYDNRRTVEYGNFARHLSFSAGAGSVGPLVDEGQPVGLGVNPSAFTQVTHPHTIILLASAPSRRFSMMMVANAISAAAATTIHMRDLICTPPWIGWAERVNPMLRLFAMFLMVSCG